MELTQQANKLKFSTLDSTLTMRNNQGEKVSKSKKCSDIDQEMPQLLNISKAIIENVIFVHQEESNWPLEANDKDLKCKFDEIFMVERHRNALEEVDVLRKSKTKEVKEFQVRLDQSIQVLNEAEQLQKKLDETNAQIAEIERIALTLSTRIAKWEQTKNNLNARRSAVAVQENQLAGARIALGAFDAEITAIAATLTSEFTESHEELIALQHSVDSAFQTHSNRLAAIRNERDSLTNETQKVQALHSDAVRKSGEHEQSVKLYQNLVQRRSSTVREFARKHNAGESFLQGQVFTTTTNQFLLALERTKTERHDALAARKRDAQAEISALDAQARRFGSEREQLQGAIRVRNTEIESLRGAIRGIDQRLRSAQRANEQLALLRREAELLESNIRALHPLSETQIEALQSELRVAREQHASASLLEKQLEQLNEKKTQLDSLSQQIANLNVRLGPALEQLGVESSSLAQLRAQTAERIARCSVEQSEAVKRVLSTQVALKHKQSLIETQKVEIDALVERMVVLQEQLQGRNAEDEIAECNERIARLQEEVKSTKAIAKLLDRFRRDAERSRCCPLCESALEAETDRKFNAKLAALHEKASAQQFAQMESSLRDEQRKRSELDTLKQLENEAQLLHKQIDEASAALDANQKQFTETQQLARNDEQVREIAEEELHAARGVHERVEQCIRDSEQLAQVERNHVQLAASIPIDMPNAQQLRSEVEHAESRCETLQQQLDDAWKTLREHGTAQQNLFKLQEQIRQQSTQSDAELLRQLTELKQRESEHEQHNSRDAAQCSMLDAQQKALEAQLAQVRELLDGEVQKLQNDADELGRDEFALLQLQRDIGEFERKSIMELSKTSKRSCDEYKARLEQLNSTVQALSGEEGDLNALIREYPSTRELIARNVKLRLLRLEKVNKEREIAKLREHIERETGVSDIADGIARCESKLSKLKPRKDNLDGRLEELRMIAAEKRGSLSSPTYRDAKQSFRRDLIEVQLASAAESDLEITYKALDRALVEFHREKMLEINAKIREIWQQTYRGGDIETIEIRAETPSKATARRTYNYRVLMKKGETELDMRGRCSAGQKVLASLVIRLALAEAFCLEAGMLALDEPTTNLDTFNIQSFAEALVSIVKSRRRDRNFQLIVITHDEEFVRQLAHSEQAEHYYHVSKSGNTSSIKRMEIAELL
jgi:DNA repair protein RAD50